jgi:hypothetical protein
LFNNPIPFKHPEKSSIFLGTRFIPFPLSRGRFILRGALAPLNSLNFYAEERKSKRGEASLIHQFPLSFEEEGD